MGEAPQDLLAVEDAVAGVQSATGAGMRCIAVASQRRAQLLRFAGADLVVPHFRSLSLVGLLAHFPKNA
jgi:beta-phosphoglucomutase-like phosphatase (HAD superfamily)